MPVAASPRTTLELVKPPSRSIRKGMIGLGSRSCSITKAISRPTAVPASASVCTDSQPLAGASTIA